MVLDNFKENKQEENESAKDLNQNFFVRLIRKYFPTTDDMSDGKFSKK